eukprot:2881676-Pyramimonas_sp.AAC.1
MWKIALLYLDGNTGPMDAKHYSERWKESLPVEHSPPCLCTALPGTCGVNSRGQMLDIYLEHQFS